MTAASFWKLILLRMVWAFFRLGLSLWIFKFQQQQQQQQSFISCPEKFTVDKYIQRETLTIKKMSTAT